MGFCNCWRTRCEGFCPALCRTMRRLWASLLLRSWGLVGKGRKKVWSRYTSLKCLLYFMFYCCWIKAKVVLGAGTINWWSHELWQFGMPVMLRRTLVSTQCLADFPQCYQRTRIVKYHMSNTLFFLGPSMYSVSTKSHLPIILHKVSYFVKHSGVLARLINVF